MTISAMQLPLIHCVESDDVYLRQRSDVLWYQLLTKTPWGADFRSVAAQYYEALWSFNVEQARSQAASRTAQPNPETEQEATNRLLFDRATMSEDAPILAGGPPEELPLLHVNAATVAPGVPPPRFAGRRPKCFFSMFEAFMAIAVKGRAPEPATIFEELRDNPSFARACGFTLPDPERGYRWSDVPSLRKLEQFDQIMTDRGLWDRAAVQQVRANLKSGVVEIDATLVHDTTHYHAHSTLRTVDVPGKPADPEAKKERGASTAGSAVAAIAEETTAGATALAPVAAEAAAQDPVAAPVAAEATAKGPPAGETPKEDKRKKRKSHPRTTKNCRCEDRKTCSHEWISADPGAGTIVKGGGKMHWGQKASTLTFAHTEGVLLDAVAMTDAASHDSNSVLPHTARLFEQLPELKGLVNRMLDDSAADDVALKATMKERFFVELLCAPNPRGRKPITTDLPRGMDHLTNLGVPVCRAGVPLDFLGSRPEEKRFLFRAPDAPSQEGTQARDGSLFQEEAKPICEGCPHKPDCCRDGAQRRHVSIPFERLPWIDPAFPQLSVGFKTELAKRTVIERLHKLMKDDFGDEDLTKRGTKAFQARLDKTKLAMHLVLALPAADSS